MRARTAPTALVTLALLAAGTTAQAPPPPPPPSATTVSRSATAVAAAVLRAASTVSEGARAPGSCLIAIRPHGAVMAGTTKVVFGQVNMLQVELAVHDKRSRRVEVLGLGGNSFVFMAAPRRSVSVPVPPGFGPPLAMRIEPAPPLPPVTTLFR